MSRQLAYIAQITNIEQIFDKEGKPANTIEYITLNDGWRCVSGKGNFQVGDKAIYFEIDSLIPKTLDVGLDPNKTINFYGNEFWRIKTFRALGYNSQGYAIPPRLLNLDSVPLDTDVTNLLGVIQYKLVDPETHLEQEGKFPEKFKETSQVRIQNLNNPRLENLLKKNYFEKSLKLEGQSMTIYKLDGKIGVCSHHYEYKYSADNKYWAAAERQGIITALEKYDGDIGLQGELMGPNMEGNIEKLTEREFFLFDIQNPHRNNVFVPRSERMGILQFLNDNGAKIKHTPSTVVFIGEASNYDATKADVLIDTTGKSIMEIRQIIMDMANGPSMKAKWKEGDVYKSVDGFESFKVISSKYLENAK